ncbi:MAG: hypothetical protein HQL07_03400 [Nitrospirae bacterium]|nr:hypothetical protein [Magnetococcales bacterium]
MTKVRFEGQTRSKRATGECPITPIVECCACPFLLGLLAYLKGMGSARLLPRFFIGG